MVLKLGHFGNLITNTLKVLKCRAEEGWRSAGPSVWRMKKYYKESGVLHRVRRIKKVWIMTKCQKYFIVSEELQRVTRMTNSQKGKEHRTYNKTKAGKLDWSHLVYYFLPKTRCWRKTEGRRKRWRRRKKLLDELTETRKLWKLREEAVDRTLWRTRLGRGYGSVVRQEYVTTIFICVSVLLMYRVVSLYTSLCN